MIAMITLADEVNQFIRREMSQSALDWIAENRDRWDVMRRCIHDHTDEKYWESPSVTLKQVLADPRHTNDVYPGMSGVYFLILDGEIVYVGSAGCVWERMCHHFRNSQPFTAFNFVRCSPEHLVKWESRYIKEFWPARNTVGKSARHPKNWWNKVKCAGCGAVEILHPGRTSPCTVCGKEVSSPSRADWPPRGVQLLPLGLPTRAPESGKPRIRIGEAYPKFPGPSSRRFGAPKKNKRTVAPPKNRTPFELLCLKVHGSLDLAREALNASAWEFNRWINLNIPPAKVTIKLKAMHVDQMIHHGVYKNARNLDSLYSVVCPRGFFQTPEEIAKIERVATTVVRTRAREGLEGWYYVPRGFDPFKDAEERKARSAALLLTEKSFREQPWNI